MKKIDPANKIDLIFTNVFFTKKKKAFSLNIKLIIIDKDLEQLLLLQNPAGESNNQVNNRKDYIYQIC